MRPPPSAGVALLIVGILISLLCIKSLSAQSTQLLSLRLPNTTAPIKYNVHIVTNIHKEILDFSGNVTIDILIQTSTDRIVLHARDLTDFIVTVTDLATGDELDGIEHIHENATNFLIIYHKEKYQAFESGQHFRLEILYNGLIQSHTFGFYWSTYTDDVNNNKIYLAATQFEPISARSAFPCFDEPAFKSKFVISITHGSNYTALSNMPASGEPIECSNNMTTTTFLETPIMSTYLLAFVVSNFEHITDVFNGITQSVYFPPHSKDNGQKGLKNSIITLSVLENYLGVRYPLPKLDHIALRKSFGLAMENWGLITYNRDNFIQNSDNDQLKVLKNILTQNHEIAHQWFGDLVSPEWWTYAWLNEGFATYFSYIVTDLVYPDLKVMEYFIDTVADMAFSWPINRPLSFYVEKETEIMSVFDMVSYQRAACIIKMFHHALNQKTFVKGVAHYLTDFQYSAANEDNLFESIQRAINEDHPNRSQLHIWNHSISDIMYSWTHNQGIPIVTVIRNYSNNSITLRQRSSSTKNPQELWWIPLSFATASRPNFETTTANFVMPPKQEVLIYPHEHNISLDVDDWLIINKQQTGFYHVFYDENNLRAIAKVLSLNCSEIHYLNRALLFRDILSVLEKSEIESIDIVFELLKYLKNEEQLLPWSSAEDSILLLASNLFGTSCFGIYKHFIRTLIAPIFRRIYNMPQVNFTASGLSSRKKLINVACRMDLTECLEFAKRSAQNYIFNNIEEEDLLMRDILLCQGIKYLNAQEFQSVLGKLATLKPNSTFYDDIVYTLRCSENPDNLKYFLNVLLGENSTYSLMTATESMQYVFFLYTSNLFARPIVMQFFEENYKTLWKLELFAEIFTRISGYVSERDKQKVLNLLSLVERDQKLSDEDVSKFRIDMDVKKIGIKSKKKDMFVRNFGESIYKWLTNNTQPQLVAENAVTNDVNGRILTDARYLIAAGLLRKFVQQKQNNL